MSPASLLKRVRRRTWIIITAGVALVAAAAVTLVVILPGQSQAEEVTTTSTASLETLEQTVSGSGTLSPLVSEEIAFPASGTVTSVAVVEGQAVVAGDELGRIDQLQAKADLAQAKADLADAEAQLSDASSSAAKAAAEASVSVAEASVEDAQDALDGTTLTAPVDGVVTAVGVEVGDVVGSTSGAALAGSTSSGSDTSTTAFTIVGTDAWQVEVSVGEADVELIAVGNQVELATDDNPSFFGVVTEIGLLPSTSSGSARYPVTIEVTGTPEDLYDGVSVSASIVYERRTDVLTVPSAAVTTQDDGTSTVLVVAEDGSQVETVVEVGATSGSLTEILSGLSEGDEVVVATFTPGEGNAGTGGFPGGGQLPDGVTFPDGGGLPDGGGFPGGGFPGQGGAGG